MSQAGKDQEVLEVPNRPVRSPNARERQADIERFWQNISARPGFSMRMNGSAHIICWKDPGPGEIFNFAGTKQDRLVLGNGAAGLVDICRAEARCLYLVSRKLDAIKLLLYTHHLHPASD